MAVLARSLGQVCVPIKLLKESAVRCLALLRLQTGPFGPVDEFCFKAVCKSLQDLALLRMSKSDDFDELQRSGEFEYTVWLGNANKSRSRAVFQYL